MASKYPILFSFQGYLYNDFLLDLGQAAEVLRRAIQTLQWAEEGRWLLNIGLDHVSFGRAHPQGSPNPLSTSIKPPNICAARVVSTLCQSLCSPAARNAISTKSTASLLVAACAFIRPTTVAQARYRLSQGEASIARDHTDKAATLIAQTGLSPP